ncbi:MAG: hypothetical protein EKK49_00785 [Rhodocyclaceae bacterium]|nr:MAG: hypothetical protein EKK49_00785 [Rhodocyclaceae bacterium]
MGLTGDDLGRRGVWRGRTGDKRLVLLADRLEEQPLASIPEACRGLVKIHMAYNFLGRETLDWREFMQPHWDASAQRMRSHLVVLRLQDTTELDFEGQTTQGLGPLSYEAQCGMYVYPIYAVTLAREPFWGSMRECGRGRSNRARRHGRGWPRACAGSKATLGWLSTRRARQGNRTFTS